MQVRAQGRDRLSDRTIIDNMAVWLMWIGARAGDDAKTYPR